MQKPIGGLSVLAVSAAKKHAEKPSLIANVCRKIGGGIYSHSLRAALYMVPLYKGGIDCTEHNSHQTATVQSEII